MYNNFPYNNFYQTPYTAFPKQSNGILNSLKPTANITKKNFNWDGFLNNAQRTLNVINQAMPIYKEVKPIFSNMGTVFKVIGQLASPVSSVATASSAATSTVASASPTFFA